MPEQTTPSSDGSDDIYRGLHPSDVEFLREMASRLKSQLGKSAIDVIEIGSLLASAKERLGRGNWDAWLKAEAEIAKRSAVRMISVARTFGMTPVEKFRHFTPTALYVLSEPGTPQSVRRRALEQATYGVAVTAGQVREWIASHRRLATAAREDPLEKTCGDALPSDGNPDAAAITAEELEAQKRAVENWLLVDSLLMEEVMIHLSATELGTVLVQRELEFSLGRISY